MEHFSFNALRDLAQKELTEHLDQYSGDKTLVWDEALTGPLDLVANFQFLRDRGVVKMFPLKQGRLPPTQTRNVVFVVRPQVFLMDLVADNVKREEAGNRSEKPDFHLLFVPTSALLCERRLKDKGVFGSFTFIDSLKLYWFPLDDDLISMEQSGIFSEFHLNKDPTCLYPLAKALHLLQTQFGVIQNVCGKGKGAKQLFEYMTQMRKEMISEEPHVPPLIDNLVILDRQIDMISPLVTQLTYEGLIDEMFSIRHGSVKLPAEKFKAVDGGTSDNLGMTSEVKQIHLNSGDELFSILRDRSFNAVGPVLSKTAKSVAAQFDERHEAKTVKELKDFVDKIPQMQMKKQSVSLHTTLAEMIKEQADKRQFLDVLRVEQELLNFRNVDRPMDYIEDAACDNVEFLRLLRVACLQSVVSSGLRPKVLESYRRILLQSYGYQHMISLTNLEKLGLLCPQSGARNYAVLRKRLQLTLDDVDEQNPTDIAYVHSVYAPLTVRLLQHFAKPGWRSIRDVLDVLPGPTLEDVQAIPYHLRKRRSADEPSVTLVVFVGGCTYAEISALRFLTHQEDSSMQFFVATTSLINGNSFLSSITTDIHDSVMF